MSGDCRVANRCADLPPSRRPTHVPRQAGCSSRTPRPRVQWLAAELAMRGASPARSARLAPGFPCGPSRGGNSLVCNQAITGRRGIDQHRRWMTAARLAEGKPEGARLGRRRRFSHRCRAPAAHLAYIPECAFRRAMINAERRASLETTEVFRARTEILWFTESGSLGFPRHMRTSHPWRKCSWHSQSPISPRPIRTVFER